MACHFCLLINRDISTQEVRQRVLELRNATFIVRWANHRSSFHDVRDGYAGRFRSTLHLLIACSAHILPKFLSIHRSLPDRTFYHVLPIEIMPCAIKLI